MIFYFSGISDRHTYSLLDGIVTDFLVDDSDIDNLPPAQRIGMLDSGAYRLYKKGLEISRKNFIHVTQQVAERCERIVAPDVIGKPDRTLDNFEAVRNFSHLSDKIFPVWQWNAPQKHLDYYLSQSELVGIGGLARIFHLDKTPEEKQNRDRVLSELKQICQSYPKRFHIFGLNYLKAIEELSPLIFSADSSVWLRGAKYAYVIFTNAKNGHLTQAPARAIPEFARLNRDQRCAVSAKNINNFCKRF